LTLVLGADVGSLFATHGFTLSRLLPHFSDQFAANCRYVSP
jgi:hypothetical protein